MKRRLQGKVVSIKVAKTIVVAVSSKKPHPMYKKLIVHTKRLSVDTGSFSPALGDVVIIEEIRPMSKTKFFKSCGGTLRMIQLRSILTVADNSGAKRLSVIHVFGGSKRKFGRIGDIVNCVVKDAIPTGTVQTSQIVKAVLVRSRKEFRREDGSYVRFSDNAAVVIDNPEDKNPVGTRIFGPVAREIRDKGFLKIASMAVEVV